MDVLLTASESKDGKQPSHPSQESGKEEQSALGLDGPETLLTLLPPGEVPARPESTAGDKEVLKEGILVTEEAAQPVEMIKEEEEKTLEEIREESDKKTSKDVREKYLWAIMQCMIAHEVHSYIENLQAEGGFGFGPVFQSGFWNCGR